MRLSIDQVKKVAKLANLPINANLEEQYANQLSKILEYIKQLNQVDTDGVLPIYNVSRKDDELRKDNLSNSLTQEEALQNSSNKMNGFFVTKGVFQEK